VKQPPNLFQITPIKVSDRPMVALKNPCHGPITPDAALEVAAWLVHVAAPHTKTKVAELLKAIPK
jgi:hypothetical protein